MKALLLVDKPNWAYDAIAKAITKYNKDTDVSLDTMPIKGNEKKVNKAAGKYDRILVMGYQTFDRLDISKEDVMVGIHSAHSWDDKKTTPDKDVTPPRKLIEKLNGFQRVNAVSRRLYKQFRDAGVKKIYYTPNGADTEIFKPGYKENKKMTVGYSGSKAHDWRKGVSEFIIPAAKKAKAETRLAMLSTGTHLPLDKMPSFYQSLNAYICASSSEGFSLSVLEAASCGVPVISTRVGGCVDLIRDGVDGFLVDRNVDAFADKISLLNKNVSLRVSMSKSIRDRVVRDFCWSKQTQGWIDFIKG